MYIFKFKPETISTSENLVKHVHEEDMVMMEESQQDEINGPEDVLSVITESTEEDLYLYSQVKYTQQKNLATLMFYILQYNMLIEFLLSFKY